MPQELRQPYHDRQKRHGAMRPIPVQVDTLNITIHDEAAIHHLMRSLGKSEREVLAAIEKGGGDIEQIVRVLGRKWH